MSKAWVIVAHLPIEYNYYDTREYFVGQTVNIATFDTEAAAKQYIDWAKLKHSSHYYGRVFRKTSLLEGYESADVEIYYPTNLPHNPTPKGGK